LFIIVGGGFGAYFYFKKNQNLFVDGYKKYRDLHLRFRGYGLILNLHLIINKVYFQLRLILTIWWHYFIEEKHLFNESGKAPYIIDILNW